MIKISNLCYTYENEATWILEDLNLEIRKGDYVAIIGPNGSGKTTFIRHINGLLMPTRGDVWVDGKNTKDFFSAMEIRRKVGMVFQNPDNQIIGMSVEEDVSFGPGNLGLPPAEIRTRIMESLEVVNMADAAQKSTHALSNGEKQLVAIAGGALVLVGGLLWLASKGGVLGNLPGDIRIERPGVTCFFPLATSIVISVVLTIVLNIVARLLRR